MEIKIGQLYAFKRDPAALFWTIMSENVSRDETIRNYDTVFEVTRVDGFIGITPVKDRHCTYLVGAEHIESADRITKSGQYMLIWSPDVKAPQVEEYGVNCSKCKNFYPDAIKASGFKCWGCRNGF